MSASGSRELGSTQVLLAIAGVTLAVAGVATVAGFRAAPPGINGDAARLGLYALDLLDRGIWPFYVFHQFGPQPLLIYLQALAFALLGPSVMVLHGLTGALGALTVPFAVWVTWELFHRRGARFALTAAGVAGLGMALAPFWTTFSRYGFEPSLLPLVELVTLGALARGIRRGRKGWMAVGGALVGLAQYSYIVGRAFPLVLLGVAIVALRSRLHWRRSWPAAAAYAVVSLPQWLFFLRYPYTFAARAGTSAGQWGGADLSPLIRLATEAWHLLMALGWRWENGYDPFSSRPMLTVPLTFGLVVALIMALRGRRAELGLGLLAAGMMLPDLVVWERLWSQATRAMGAYGLLYPLAGAGLAQLAEIGRAKASWWRWAVVAAVVAAGAEAQWDYARRVVPEWWAAEGLEWRASLVELAEADVVLASPVEGTVLVPASEFQRPELAFALATRYRMRRACAVGDLVPGEPILVVQPLHPERPTSDAQPAGYREDLWVLLRGDSACTLLPLAGVLRPTGDATPVMAENGVHVADAYHAQYLVDGVAPDRLGETVGFGNGVKMRAAVAGALDDGQPLAVTLEVRTTELLHRDLQLFVQLVDRDRVALAGVTDWPLHGVYRMRAWRPGEAVPLAYELLLPRELPVGAYTLEAGLIDVLSQQRVPTDDGGKYATLEQLVVRPSTPTVVLQHAIDARFSDSIALEGWSVRRDDGGLTLQLHWRALAPPTKDYAVFVHALGADGSIMAQADGDPVGGRYPTTLWQAGEVILDEHRIDAAEPVDALLVGLYRRADMARLPVSLDGVPVPDDAIRLVLPDGQ